MANADAIARQKIAEHILLPRVIADVVAGFVHHGLYEAAIIYFTHCPISKWRRSGTVTLSFMRAKLSVSYSSICINYSGFFCPPAGARLWLLPFVDALVDRKLRDLLSIPREANDTDLKMISDQMLHNIRMVKGMSAEAVANWVDTINRPLLP